MALRVTSTGKDRDRDITSLCGAWGRTSKSLAIREIESGTYRYYVQDFLGVVANVEVYRRGYSKHLRTDPDSSCLNNLDNLPDC